MSHFSPDISNEGEPKSDHYNVDKQISKYPLRKGKVSSDYEISDNVFKEDHSNLPKSTSNLTDGVNTVKKPYKPRQRQFVRPPSAQQTPLVEGPADAIGSGQVSSADGPTSPPVPGSRLETSLSVGASFSPKSSTANRRKPAVKDGQILAGSDPVAELKAPPRNRGNRQNWRNVNAVKSASVEAQPGEQTSGQTIRKAAVGKIDDPKVSVRQSRYIKKPSSDDKRPMGRYLMCVHVKAGATEIAVMEGRRLVEHHVAKERDNGNQIDGNIYYGRVINVLPGMEAAFVDIGTPKNAVLYWGDVQLEEEEKDSDAENSVNSHTKRIEQLLKPGQMILCQVTKNPIGLKGARLTQGISLAGRFVVLMPGSDSGGISKRLGDQERKRLRKFIDDVKPAGCGLIVRTAAAGVSVDELKTDVEQLTVKWSAIEAKLKKATGPELLYSEPHIAMRVIREELNDNYRAVVIDDYELYLLLKSYVEEFDPLLAEKISYYDVAVERLPMYERYAIHEQLHKALDKKVWLASGGSLIIEKTEALTVIDVNTGKNVGKSSLGETVYQNNIEAAREIARQLRLRDIGGIIVIDFIDMEDKPHRDDVLSVLRQSLAEDKTPTQAYPISELGLVEMTRKRIGEGLVESLSNECPHCHGMGYVFEDMIN